MTYRPRVLDVVNLCIDRAVHDPGKDCWCKPEIEQVGTTEDPRYLVMHQRRETRWG